MAYWKNIAGTWKSGKPWKNIGGVWREGNLWRNIAGTWKLVYQRFTLTQDKSAIAATGYGSSDVANITSTVSTTFVWTLASGSNITGISFGPASGTTTFVQVVNPMSGSGDLMGTYRCQASNGDSVLVDVSQSYGELA